MDWSPYRLIYLTNAALMTDELRKRIEQTLNANPDVRFVADGSFGLYSADGQSSYGPPEGFAERVGVRVADFNAITERDIALGRNVLQTPGGDIPISTPCGYAVLEPKGEATAIASLEGETVAVRSADGRFTWWGMSLSAGFGNAGHPDLVLPYVRTGRNRGAADDRGLGRRASRPWLRQGWRRGFSVQPRALHGQYHRPPAPLGEIGTQSARQGGPCPARRRLCVDHSALEARSGAFGLGIDRPARLVVGRCAVDVVSDEWCGTLVRPSLRHPNSEPANVADAVFLAPEDGEHVTVRAARASAESRTAGPPARPHPRLRRSFLTMRPARRPALPDSPKRRHRCGRGWAHSPGRLSRR